jgi:hypothetical protein
MEKAATHFENSVFIDHWRKQAEITAIKQQKSKENGNDEI